MTDSHLTRRGRAVAAAIGLILLVSAGAALARMGSGSDDEPAVATAPSPSPFVAVDDVPPRLSLEKPGHPVLEGKPMVLSGRAKGAKTVTAAGRRVRPGPDGRFTIRLSDPASKVRVVAEDAAGNRSVKMMSWRLHRIPEKIRAVHVSAYGWASRRLRRPVLKMIEQGRINAVEIDLKDESGIVGYDSKVPLVNKVKADRDIHDLRATIDMLHRLDVRVIGRLVAFRDPILASASWKRRQRDRVIQTPGGEAYADYGGFTNFSHPAVRKYQIDIAEEAARAGIDDVLYDYVRRPDGPIKTMVFKGLRTSPERSIASFVAETERRLRPYGVRVGASVFGIAATRPKEIAQDIGRIARAADYVAPMLYPSHWASGEYNVANPNAQPYKIVYRSLRDFQKELKGTEARIVPWIQDFSLGIHYGPGRVRAQIIAARKRGIEEWILWDPSVTYTAEALIPRERKRS